MAERKVVSQYACGCQIIETVLPSKGLNELSYTIEYCPKHNAAHMMYKALRNIRANIGHIIMTKADAILVDQIDKALAKAEGKEG